jgi:hypothetical protein
MGTGLHVATHRVVIPAQAGIQSQQHTRHTDVDGIQCVLDSHFRRNDSFS